MAMAQWHWLERRTCLFSKVEIWLTPLPLGSLRRKWMTPWQKFFVEIQYGGGILLRPI